MTALRVWCAICGHELTAASRPCACPRGMAVPVQAPKKETSK
jgi:hypothetical protein